MSARVSAAPYCCSMAQTRANSANWETYTHPALRTCLWQSSAITRGPQRQPQQASRRLAHPAHKERHDEYTVGSDILICRGTAHRCAGGHFACATVPLVGAPGILGK